MSIIEKNKLAGEKKIILALGIFLIVACGFLSFIEERNLKGIKADSWELYFANPKSEQMTFTIKNNGKEASFRWKAFSGSGKTLGGGEEFLLSKDNKTIFLEEKNIGEVVTIEIVGSEGEKKEIYKR